MGEATKKGDEPHHQGFSLTYIRGMILQYSLFIIPKNHPYINDISPCYFIWLIHGPRFFSCGKPLVTLHSENLRTRPWDFITYSASVLQLVLMVLDGVVMAVGWFWGGVLRWRMGV
jgi:hypothetical protein